MSFHKNLILNSPLEQFEIKVYYPFGGYNFDFSIVNVTLFLLLVTVLTSAFFVLGLYNATIIPSSMQALCEQSYSFLVTVIKQQAGSKGLRYLPLFITIFFFVLFSNLIGLVPFAFTPTSHIAFTFTVALTCNLAFLIVGFKENGLAFLRLFVPKGGPLLLYPIIIVIEIVSYLLRTFSLSIRLFANMMAGHTLLHILTSFVTTFLLSGYPILSLFPFMLVLAVSVLELAIAFLQAYVFLILLSIYLNDALHPSH